MLVTSGQGFVAEVSAMRASCTFKSDSCFLGKHGQFIENFAVLGESCFNCR